MIERSVILVVALLAGCSGGGPRAVTAAPPEAPPAHPGQLVVGERLLALQLPPRPEKGAPFRDPLYGIAVTRVTDRERDGFSDSGIKQEYARVDPENADGSLLVLRGNQGRWYLYDTTTFRLLKRLPIGEGGQEPEPRWDDKDPHLLYHLSGMQLRSLDVERGTDRVVHDFSADAPGNFVVTGGEGDASLDRRVFCFIVKRVVGSDWRASSVIVYDRAAGRVVGRKTDLPASINWVSADMSGRHCLIGWEGLPVAAYSPDLSREVKLPEGARGHCDLALTADRRDVLVYQDVKTDWIAMADLDSGRAESLLRIPFQVNPDIGLHFSGNAARVPGWVLVSTYGAKRPPAGRHRSWMDSQIFMLELRSSPRVWRVAGARSFTFVTPEEGEKAYFAEPFAAINTRGTRIYWGANWGQTDLRRIDLYMAQLPGNWAELLSPVAGP